ncbi:hypothetical protein L2E82_14819 [Cichorium intybus]|uniref:Uncharacterized protein n=1 Tax=Cichorium intybus TaxID=13427 RepID=A0ACB9F1N7_CICIN|nr:hypothetical protein L2E82_14819 [Cichorium intybus]
MEGSWPKDAATEWAKLLSQVDAYIVHVEPTEKSACSDQLVYDGVELSVVGCAVGNHIIDHWVSSAVENHGIDH